MTVCVIVYVEGLQTYLRKECLDSHCFAPTSIDKLYYQIYVYNLIIIFQIAARFNYMLQNQSMIKNLGLYEFYKSIFLILLYDTETPR